MEFEPVAPVRAYQRVVEQIEQAVLSGDLVPGQRLPSERELMAQFEVSRSTVREALRVLQAGEVIRSKAGDPRGPEVLPASPTILHKSLHRLARAEQLGLGALLQFRMLLEGSAYQLAAGLRTEQQLGELEGALQRMVSGVDGDFTAFSHADLAFHEVIARATQNPLIVACGQVVRGLVLELIEDKLAHAADRHALMRASVAHHTDMLHAVRDGDGARAGTLARKALYDYYAEYVPEPDRALLDPLLDSER